MSKKATVIAVVNQKGGTGKTTTTENLGVGLAMEGKRVLLVDTDPQASLTVSLGNPYPDTLCSHRRIHRLRHSGRSSDGYPLCQHDPGS